MQDIDMYVIIHVLRVPYGPNRSINVVFGFILASRLFNILCNLLLYFLHLYYTWLHPEGLSFFVVWPYLYLFRNFSGIGQTACHELVYAILLKETVRRNTGNIIHTAKGIDQSHILFNDWSLNFSLLCVSFKILPITAKRTLVLYKDISSQIKL